MGGAVARPAGAGSPKKVALASLIGTTIEWYDFFIYSTAAVLVFNHHFFPSFDPAIGTLLAFSTFAAGFVARPIGAIVFGHFGDRVGRKSMMVVTILIMGVATVLIGLLPTYATIGAFAPVLLVLLRLTQGFALGGEWGGAALMATEHSPDNRRGFFGSWPQAGVAVGLILAMTVYLPLDAMADDHFMAWGWRVPFLLSAVLVITGLIIRVQVAESPEFDRVKDVHAVVRLPIIEVLRTHPKQVLLVAGASLSPGIFFYLLTVYNFVYTQEAGGLSQSSMLILVIVTSAVGFVVTPIAGALSDRFGRQRLFLLGLALIGSLAFPLYWALDSGSYGFIAVCYVAATIAVYIPWALQPAYFSEAFDARVRYSGLSLATTLGNLLGSAIAPLIAGTLLSATHASISISLYVFVTAALSFVCVLVLGRTNRKKDTQADSGIGTDNVSGLRTPTYSE
ncbi:MFS transporter [Rhodococcus opacus]|uniref:Putative proline/betaine transporter n=1 Tax=Rhodococcus opacus TaxID=37919 RepID=A0AAX3YDZ5_RHOOP|nr:MFS transporter [Rhodococcus opacus]ELB89708.1 MFS transporter [Rhodococcus wratislaviensis IFP 2016]NDV09960.1 MHS family MFS transporter [Rhodococcus sp. IEGM 248]NHU44762.1 MHS family MFS transporter [Rhodococcus sp. A14]MBA8960809.1 metabolite-proton symporter [Rhodococcus opacus]MBP2203325.1 metabolite-proton symporter [Rhodococcus opacus]